MILEILILVLAVPIGILIAKLAEDELAAGKKYFRILIIVSLLGGIWFLFTRQEVLAWTAWFIFIVSFISYSKGTGKKPR